VRISTIDIIPFEAQYADRFYELNVAWLEDFFYVEPYDEKVLSNPEENILRNGGFIFFAKTDSLIVGTVALINQGNFFELSKMAVMPDYQGKKIGLLLMKYCIQFARAQQWKSITLYSHKKLVPAIQLYRKMGFQEIPLEEKSHYKRSDIKMRLNL